MTGTGWAAQLRLAAFALVTAMTPGEARAEIVDRIAAIVGPEAITQSEVDDELRLAAMLNRTHLQHAPEAVEDALRRLIDRRLIQQDMVATPFLLAEPSEVETELRHLREATFVDGKGFSAALSHYDLTPEDVRANVKERIAFERYVSFRFKTGLDVDAEDLVSYYRDEFAALQRERGQPVEPFAAVSEAIAEILTERRASELLTQRMRELRALTNVRVVVLPQGEAAP